MITVCVEKNEQWMTVQLLSITLPHVALDSALLPLLMSLVQLWTWLCPQLIDRYIRSSFVYFFVRQTGQI